MKPNFMLIAKGIALKSSTEFYDKAMINATAEALEKLYNETIEEAALLCETLYIDSNASAASCAKLIREMGK